MAKPYNLVSRDAQIALNEFSSDFDAAYATVDPDSLWAAQFGRVNTSAAIRTTYPFSLSTAGYKERKGDDKLRELNEVSLSMTNREWSDGVQILAATLEAPDFVGYDKEPQNIAREASRLPNTLVAALLESNPYLDIYRHEFTGGSVASTIRLFDNSHPVNIFDTDKGTFDNLQAADGFTAAMLKAAKLRFRQKKAPNGTPFGLRLTHMLVPAALEEEAKDFLESDNLLIAVQNVAKSENVGGIATNNRHKGTVQLVVCDELTIGNRIYLLDANRGLYPWIVQTGGSTPEEIRYDKDSELYKSKGKVGVKFVLKMGVAAALPAAIEAVDLSNYSP